MHIEPGIVVGAKLALGFVTATGAVGYSLKLAKDMAGRDGIALVLFVNAISFVAVLAGLLMIDPAALWTAPPGKGGAP